MRGGESLIVMAPTTLHMKKMLKKKMKMRQSRSSTSFMDLSDDIMLEVVARLPLKSLFICKSVCKRLISLIYQPQFLKLYINHWNGGGSTRRFLLSIRDGSHQRYLLGTIINNVVDFEEWFSVPFTKYDGVTQVIDGLVCFYKGCRVWICNLSTGEIMNLPSPRFDNDNNARYFFGFDPISTTYKLLKVDETRVCEILTIGDMSWKFTKMHDSSGYIHFQHEFPAGATMDEAFCVDGSLHWPQGEIGAISFHLNEHNFDFRFFLGMAIVGAVLQFNGRLTLAYNSTSIHHLKIITLIEYKWINHTFELPIQQKLIPFSCLPTGEIMLLDAEYSDHCIYSFDPESHKFDRFVVGKFPKPKLDSSARISCFQPNFNPLSLILKRNSGL